MPKLKIAATLIALTSVGAALLCDGGGAAPPFAQGQREGTAGRVLRPGDGEVRVPCGAEGRHWNIKVDPVNAASRRMAMGTQRLPARSAIPVHRHEHEDEILFVHEGKGMGILGDERVPVEAGTTVYIPQGVWHGVENPSDPPAQIVWVVAPPGLEGYFREAGAPPGADCQPIPPDVLAEIQRRHGMTVLR